MASVIHSIDACHCVALLISESWPMTYIDFNRAQQVRPKSSFFAEFIGTAVTFKDVILPTENHQISAAQAAEIKIVQEE